MTNTYNSKDRDTLDVPSFDCTGWSFSVTPKDHLCGRFTLLIIAHAECQNALVEFFEAQQKKAAKDRSYVTATDDKGSSIQLTVTEEDMELRSDGRKFELIATMKNQDLRRKASIVRGKTRCSTII
ncbi:hypothetical protein [Aeromonas veronii]|uniref:hypothetical protein n=1 Tax=Aeromonas veronii TaxID=654 RepID=UPI0011167817|nr:hypothetical protein [Aeromonas veronii]TNI26507.1 hypothetical protein CF108_14155 [Aeromonas veronii]